MSDKWNDTNDLFYDIISISLKHTLKDFQKIKHNLSRTLVLVILFNFALHTVLKSVTLSLLFICRLIDMIIRE